MSNKCEHCGFVLPTGGAKVAKCPRCNLPLPTAPAESPAPESPANAWLEMRREAGLGERIHKKPWNGGKK